ncbi:hypothetical protein ACFL6C_06640 [Myxococcota bacterium]
MTARGVTVTEGAGRTVSPRNSEIVGRKAQIDAASGLDEHKHAIRVLGQSAITKALVVRTTLIVQKLQTGLSNDPQRDLKEVQDLISTVDRHLMDMVLEENKTAGKSSSDEKQADLDRLTARRHCLEDVRATLVATEVCLLVETNPDTPARELLDPLVQELERTRECLSKTASDSPRHTDLLKMQEGLQTTLHGLEALLDKEARLRAVVDGLGIAIPESPDATELKVAVDAIEKALGITWPEGKSVALLHRIGRLEVARRQGFAHALLWVRGDLGLGEADLVELGLLVDPASQEGRARLAAAGLDGVDPAELTPEQSLQRAVVLQRTDAKAIPKLVGILYAAWGIDGTTRDPSEDLCEITKVAHNGRAALELGKEPLSIVALRHQVVQHQGVLSSQEVRELASYLRRHRPDHDVTIEKLAKSAESLRIRFIANKMMDYPVVVAAISDSAGNIDPRAVGAFCGRVAGYVYPKPDNRVLSEKDLKQLRSFVAKRKTPLTKSDLDMLLSDPALLAAGPPKLARILKRIAESGKARGAILGADGMLTADDLERIEGYLDDIRVPIISLDGKLIMSQFCNPETMDNLVKTLSEAFSEVSLDGVDDAAVWSVLGPLSSEERKWLMIEYGRAKGNPSALIDDIRSNQKGFNAGKSIRLLTRGMPGPSQRYDPGEWNKELLELPAAWEDVGPGKPEQSLTRNKKNLAHLHGHLEIFLDPGIHSIHLWSHVPHQDLAEFEKTRAEAVEAFGRLADAVRNGNQAEMEKQHRAFAEKAGRALADYFVLEGAAEEWAAQDIADADRDASYFLLGRAAFVTTASALVAVKTFGMGASPAFIASQAAWQAALTYVGGQALRSVWAGTLVGTGMGYSIRVATGEDDWDGFVQDFQLAASSSIGVMAPTAGFRLIQGMSTFSPAQMAGWSSLFNVAGGVGSRGVYALTWDSDQPLPPDLQGVGDHGLCCINAYVAGGIYGAVDNPAAHKCSVIHQPE